MRQAIQIKTLHGITDIDVSTGAITNKGAGLESLGRLTLQGSKCIGAYIMVGNSLRLLGLAELFNLMQHDKSMLYDKHNKSIYRFTYQSKQGLTTMDVNQYEMKDIYSYYK